MILGQIAYIDIAVFLVFLTPQLIIHAGLWETAKVGIQALPFLLGRLPYHYVKERFFTPRHERTPFVQRAYLFQDFVIRCVRYAFANMPSSIGKVFFSKGVALPFLRFRMLRHGYLKYPIHWQEINQDEFQGSWFIADNTQRPDVVVYYCHGGGFSMGSSYFYMEFLFALVALLKDSGYRNPALFALEYTLVPDAVYPTQLHETIAGYDYVTSIIKDPSRICVGGDSAGATLILSMLLWISDQPDYRKRLPGLATMISPWATIISDKNRNTPSDYLSSDSLKLYGSQYVGPSASPNDPLVSPGKCKDLRRWARASPSGGWFFLFGSEEVLGPETRDLIAICQMTGAHVDVHEERGSIHAWPVATLFLSNTGEARISGLRSIVKHIRRRMG
ncbi:hypothetical protein LTR04_001669 [Oleoguttula sp. CCFEE 6159]|nr:hypothetical protein LTR04_001669 [Oleoguttula sp. CCFEE 6159]